MADLTWPWLLQAKNGPWERLSQRPLPMSCSTSLIIAVIHTEAKRAASKTDAPLPPITSIHEIQKNEGANLGSSKPLWNLQSFLNRSPFRAF